MPENGKPPAIADVVQHLEVLPRSDARHAGVARDQLVALAALITTSQEADHAAQR